MEGFKDMALTRFQNALLYIHKAEERHGSITHTPDSDPDLIAAQKLLADKYIEPTDFEPDENDLKIKKLIERGYPAHYIYEKLKVDKPRVLRIKTIYGLNYRTKFKYKISYKGRPDFYTSYAQGICNYVGISNCRSQRAILKAEKLGYTVSKISLYWWEIPDEAIYKTCNSEVFKKQGNNSWLNKELKWKF